MSTETGIPKLARRWAFHREAPGLLGARVGALLDPDGGFSDDDRERLYVWVRGRMTDEGQVLELVDYDLHTSIIARETGLSEDDAYALIEAAGGWLK